MAAWCLILVYLQQVGQEDYVQYGPSMTSWVNPYLLLSQSIPIIKWYWLNSKGMDQLKTSLTVHTVIIRFTWVKKWFFEIGPIGLDGNECPAFCPLTVSNCPENHLLCPGGSDNNGCPMPSTCLDMSLIGDFFQQLQYKINLYEFFIHQILEHHQFSKRLGIIRQLILIMNFPYQNRNDW